MQRIYIINSRDLKGFQGDSWGFEGSEGCQGLEVFFA